MLIISVKATRDVARVNIDASEYGKWTNGNPRIK
jgi:hypothetical protein